MDVAFFTRLIASRVTDTVGYLKLVNGAYGDRADKVFFKP